MLARENCISSLQYYNLLFSKIRSEYKYIISKFENNIATNKMTMKLYYSIIFLQNTPLLRRLNFSI